MESFGTLVQGSPLSLVESSASTMTGNLFNNTLEKIECCHLSAFLESLHGLAHLFFDLRYAFVRLVFVLKRRSGEFHYSVRCALFDDRLLDCCNRNLLRFAFDSRLG